jgi:Tol biopolymer transport system component
MDMETREVSTLPGSTGVFSPRWSPDGRYLAALSFEAISKKLLLYDFHSQRWAEWVTDEGGVGYPAWTADSRHVQYWSRTDPSIRRVSVGDSHPEILFSLKGLRTFFSEFGPWSDDGPNDSRLFTRDASTQEIYALDVDLP